MKKVIMIVMVLAVTGLIGAPVFAATTVSTPNIPVSATVDGAVTLTVELFKGPMTASNPPSITSLAFGTLQEKTFTNPTPPPPIYKELRSDDAGGMGEGVALITANTHQLGYSVTQTGTALTSGANTIPAGACLMNPAYSSLDNSGQSRPVGAVVAGGGSWVGTKTIYTSEPAPAQLRTIQAHYAISGDPAANATASVPVNQAPGSYTATVVISVTA